MTDADRIDRLLALVVEAMRVHADAHRLKTCAWCAWAIKAAGVISDVQEGRAQ